MSKINYKFRFCGGKGYLEFYNWNGSQQTVVESIVVCYNLTDFDRFVFEFTNRVWSGNPKTKKTRQQAPMDPIPPRRSRRLNPDLEIKEEPVKLH
jgi:hypothetical protein